jgi:hypothetical protein
MGVSVILKGRITMISPGTPGVLFLIITSWSILAAALLLSVTLRGRMPLLEIAHHFLRNDLTVRRFCFSLVSGDFNSVLRFPDRSCHLVGGFPPVNEFLQVCFTRVRVTAKSNSKGGLKCR